MAGTMHLAIFAGVALDVTTEKEPIWFRLCKTGQQANLFHPREQTWTDHFALVDGQIVGLTPIGRATAQLLGMNEPHRVRLRRELVEQGVFDVS